MKNLNGVRQEISDHLNKSIIAYKPTKPVFTQQNIRPLRIGPNHSGQGNGNLLRPSISTSK